MKEVQYVGNDGRGHTGCIGRGVVQRPLQGERETARQRITIAAK